MEIKWSGPQEVEQEGKRKPIVAEAAMDNRFVLYQSGGTMIPTMWSMYDQETQTTYFLKADDWDDAKRVASERITEALTPKRKARKKA
jgi:hypothetical protein